MRVHTSILLLVFAFAIGATGQSPYVVVLGTGQDAGVPQMGCDTPFCREAWANASLRELVSSIALVDPSSRSRWIFDATPDLPEQFEYVKRVTKDRSNRLDGIFLTHAHIGHYTGLMFLGRESMGSKEVPVYAMPRMKKMLEENAPWSQLVGLKNITIIPIADRQPFTVAGRIKVEPMQVPHRDEFSETVGFRISSATRSLVFIPDIDKWEKWSTKLTDLVRSSTYLLIDGTFFEDGEINRPMSEVPHPFVSETMALLANLPRSEKQKVYFTHFNHSNPLVQKNRKKITAVRSKGFRIATRGLKLQL